MLKMYYYVLNIKVLQTNKTQSMSKILLIFMILSFTIALHFQSDELVLVQVIFRHGIQKQTPIRNNLTIEQQAIRSNYYNEVTPAGLRLMYQLGKILHKKYWKKLFGTNKLNFSDIKNLFLFRNTFQNRTSQSSQAMIFGLLQKLPTQMLDAKTANFSQVPYKDEITDTSSGPVYGQNGLHNHYVNLIQYQRGMNDFTDGDILRMSESSQCPMQMYWFQQNFLIPQNLQILNNPQLKLSYQKFIQLYNIDIPISHYGFFFERKTQKQYLGQQLPQFFLEPSKLRADMYALYHLGYFIKHTSNQTQIRATMLGLFTQILANMKTLTQPTQLNRKWYSYACHKDTFLPFLAILQLSSVKCIYEAYLNGTETSDYNVCINQLPTYGSSFAFESYKRKNGSYYFKLNYNGEYLKLPICGRKQDCPLQEFEAWINTWNNHTVKDLCGYKNTTLSV